MMKQKEVIASSATGSCDEGQVLPSETWMAFVAPGDSFRHPREVLAHATLSDADKRAILAWWASDLHAVESSSQLRCLPGDLSEAVLVDDVLAALAELDAKDRARQMKALAIPVTRRRRRDPFPELHWLRRSRRDNDDPPPCPATIMPRPRSPAGGVEAVAISA